MISVVVVVPEISAGSVVVIVVVTVRGVADALMQEHAWERTELGKTSKALRRFTAAVSAGMVVNVYEPAVAPAALELAIVLLGGYVVVVKDVKVASAVPVPVTVLYFVEVATLRNASQQSADGSACINPIASNTSQDSQTPPN